MKHSTVYLDMRSLGARTGGTAKAATEPGKPLVHRSRAFRFSPAKRVIGWLQHLLEHPWFAVWLGLGAVLLMLPALKAGLFADDLVQRPFQFQLSELPPQMRELM